MLEDSSSIKQLFVPENVLLDDPMYAKPADEETAEDAFGPIATVAPEPVPTTPQVTAIAAAVLGQKLDTETAWAPDVVPKNNAG